MKIIATIVIIAMCSCFSTNKQAKYEYNTAPQSGYVNLFEKDTLRTSGDRTYIDRPKYAIIRGKYISGAKFLEVYENKLTKLDSEKEYYENGQLKDEGVMTNGSNVPVGVWKYYSSTGKLDSIVNYDAKYKIPYFEALEIAGKSGFKMPGLEVDLIADKGKTFWEFSRWSENANQTGRIGQAILIDVESGAVTNQQVMSIY